MARVDDVAAYILRQCGPMTAMKLEKLVYYSQAWSLVWDERPLFDAPIEAWANGPVVRHLYQQHRGKFEVHDWPSGHAEGLDDRACETVEAVLGFYGSKSSHWLSELTHREDPWRDARRGLLPGERGNELITHAAMAEYYGGLYGPEVEA